MRIEVRNQLFLKQLEPGDAQALFDLTDRNREVLKEWLPWLDYNKTEQDSLKFIEVNEKKLKDKQGLNLGIWFNDRLAGVIGHHGIEWNNKRASIGYWLGAEFMGKGIMTSCCEKLIDYSFSEYKLNLIEIAAATENMKSRLIPERLGFKLDGILRQREWLYDHFVDHAVYSMTKSEWEKRSRK